MSLDQIIPPVETLVQKIICCQKLFAKNVKILKNLKKWFAFSNI